MEEEDDSARVFSVRIVDIDYYMAPPIPEIDICYSSFQGGKVNEVPVIRVFGSTPAGQKTCLHVHKALPYLYVPCSDIHLNSEVQHRDDEYKHIISHALEKSLKLKGKVGSTRQHVHACSLVRARKLYGYFPTEELFVKIYLYHPQDVARAANFLLGGAVLDKCLQPYEAHIPFILQFLVDYNLYGMGFIHLSKTKFRHPIPDTITQPSSCNRLSEKLNCSPPYFKADSQVWISSTVPVNWMWPAPEALSSSCDHTTKLMKRMSTCKLEGDSTIEDILNQHHKVFLSQSQTCSDVKMVQSLIPIWEEEYERTGLHNAYVDVPPDPGKPCQADVLKILALGSEMEKNIMELFRVAEGSINPMDKDLNFVQPTFFPSNMGKSDEHGSAALSIGRTTPFEDSLDTTVLPGSTCNEHCSTSQDRVKDLLSSRTENVGTLTPKPSDEEILGALKWLASSQAAEDINSDDEILRETILNPLLPAATINKVLEKANDDYESASQLECQDILNTIEAVNEVDKILHETIFSPLLPAATINKVLEKANDDYESASQLECQDNLNTIEAVNEVDYINENLELIGGIQTPPKDGIPQVDGSFVDHWCNPQSNSSSNFNFAEASHHYEELNKSRTTSKHKASMRWGALPLSLPGNVNDNHQDVSCNALSRPGSEATLSDPTRKNSNFNVLVNSNSSCPPEGILACCSLRDLMRKKRSYRVSSPECETNKAKRVFTKEEPNSNTFICTNIESLSHEGGHHDLKSLGSSDLKSPFTECHTSITEQHDMNSSTYGVNTVSKSAIDSARLLDGGTSNYEPSSECCVDHPFEQMGLRVPHPSSESPSDGKERHLCQHGEAEVSGKCIGKLSYETHQGTHVPMQIGSCSYEHSRMTCSASCRSFPALDVEGEPCDVHKLTPCDMPEQEEQGEVHSSDECPSQSQYVKDSYDETEGQNTYSSNHDAPSCFEEAFTDAPTHHCIDGSVVYMMTPASAPPTADSVRNWVFEFDSLAHSCEEKLHDARPDVGEPNKEDHGNKIMAVDAGCDEGKTVLVNDAENVKKVCTNVFQDFSQISGPYGNSKATPLSQTGFRDSASIGCGQQLTLLSLEILAESRGDLRPDPRYDAIKVLAFAVKDDNDSVASLYALLHTPGNERNLDGLSSCNILHFNEERHMFNYMVDFILSLDPDVFMGWDIQGASLGFLIERASQLGIGLLNKISRTPIETKMDCNNLEGLEKIFHGDVLTEFGDGDSVLLDGGAIEDEWGRTHASGLHVDGRIVLNVWRLMRSEVKLTMYTVEAVAEAVLRRKVSLVNNKVLALWFSSGPSRARYRSIEFVVERAKLNLEIMDQLDMINRTSELARVFGIEFFSVLSRGSQYRVESMLLRLAHSQNYVAISPGSQQVATQPAMECLPLVMEPKSGFYADPVIVLDFQSLYPSMIIAYNLCFCTCLGKLAPPKPNILGVSSYSPEPHVLDKLKDQILFTPNGVMYVPPEVRKGVLPRLLDEILSTRIMVKQAMKKLDSSQKVLQRIFNSRQLALKLISNVTYGYTAAGFSGRMPCAELADSIVQCGRRTLETAISFVNANETWKAKVIYGDTDSLFVLLEGRSVEEAFRIGKEIAADVTRMNPDPVTLKMEKVYHPCFLLTKKRYVGYSYESPDQIDPVFDAKGIETVRRDTCGAVAKTMEQSLRLYFEHQDISKVKAYLQRQWKRIISGRVSLQDFIFAKEVRLGTYSTRNSSSIPPAAIVATKAMRVDPRAEPRYGERVPYIVVHGDPGARLVDMVVDPLDLLALDSPFRLNDQYYINKQIIPALQRVFGLVGADLSQWLSEIPRPIREAFGKRQLYNPNPYRARIDHYYISKHCILCGELAQSSKQFCENCSRNKTAMATTVITKTSKLEKDMQHLIAVCCHCGGGDWIVETGVKCTSLACSVFFERRKVQKELLSMSAVATETGLYPKCMAELF